MTTTNVAKLYLFIMLIVPRQLIRNRTLFKHTKPETGGAVRLMFYRSYLLINITQGEMARPTAQCLRVVGVVAHGESVGF